MINKNIAKKKLRNFRIFRFLFIFLFIFVFFFIFLFINIFLSMLIFLLYIGFDSYFDNKERDLLDDIHQIDRDYNSLKRFL